MLFLLILLVLVVVGMIASTMLYVMSTSSTDHQR
jgi:hypothetical protein